MDFSYLQLELFLSWSRQEKRDSISSTIDMLVTNEFTLVNRVTKNKLYEFWNTSETRKNIDLENILF